MPRIVILGGGFAGAACALHLLRDHPDLRADLTIIEPRPVLGAGLAYSTPAREHRTNVAAARMSVIPEDALHFHNWLTARGEPARDPLSEMPDGRLYPSRALFGRYVADMLDQAVSRAPHISFRHVRDEATGIAPAGPGFDITLAGGGAETADVLVLAVSHTKPDIPGPLRDCPGLIADPWDVAALARVPKAARVLIVGTGLTACDVVSSLLDHGHLGRITAISRHGLLPRPRTHLPVQAEGDFTSMPEATALGLLRRIRRAVAEAASAGRPWENVIDALRQQAAIAWGALSWAERRRLLRHARPFWDVHRFQSAPQVDTALRVARECRLLTVQAASLVETRVNRSGIAVTLRPRGAPPGTRACLEVDVVINCTGPGHRSITVSHPALHVLAESGALQADPAALGILVDGQSRVVRADGTAWPNLFVAGPLARGTFGELMGLPQVNLQPREVASALAALLTSA